MIKLHRCPATFAKSSGHPCWKVQKALDDARIDRLGSDGGALR